MVNWDITKDGPLKTLKVQLFKYYIDITHKPSRHA
jgi:hypothetical protein